MACRLLKYEQDTAIQLYMASALMDDSSVGIAMKIYGFQNFCTSTNRLSTGFS